MPTRQPKGGRVSTDLIELIRLINLIPPKREGTPELPEKLVDGLFPTTVELVSALSFLSRDFPEFVSYLLEQLNHYEELAGANVRRAIRRYNRLRSAREVLYALIRGYGPYPVDELSFLFVNGEHKIIILSDSFLSTLANVDVRQMRECVVCQKLFITRRLDSVVCDPKGKCAATHSKRNERKNAKLRAELAAKKSGKKKGRGKQ